MAIALWEEDWKVNNGRNKAAIWHLESGTIGTTFDTLISGVTCADYHNFNLQFINRHATASLRVSAYGSNFSGTTAPTEAATDTSVWTKIGEDAVAGSSSDERTWELSAYKWIMVAGSASVTMTNLVDLRLFMKSRG